MSRTDRDELIEYLAKLPPEQRGKHELREEMRGMHPFRVPGYLMLHMLVRDTHDPADVGRANAIIRLL